MNSTNYVIQLLEQEKIILTLMDIGASGEKFKPFENLIPVSNFIGFDPDSRDIRIDKEKYERKSIFFNKAITSLPQQKEVIFYLTKSPHCSSTLKPVIKNLNQWPYAKLFEVVKEVSVPCMTISEALKEANLDHIDWLKIDSQGTDLRIIESIPNNIFNNMIACDVEPGLYEHYENADLFPKIHMSLINKGFYLADLNLQKQPRISESNWNSLQTRNSSLKFRELINQSLKCSPTATEARYIRTIPSAIELNYDYKKFLIMWAISLSTGNLSYAYDIASEIEKNFSSKVSQSKLTEQTYKIIALEGEKKAYINFLNKLWGISKKLIYKIKKFKN